MIWHGEGKWREAMERVGSVVLSPDASHLLRWVAVAPLPLPAHIIRLFRWRQITISYDVRKLRRPRSNTSALTFPQHRTRQVVATMLPWLLFTMVGRDGLVVFTALYSYRNSNERET